MRKSRLLLSAILTFVFVLAAVETSAQSVDPNGEISPNATAAEIVAWLDETSFAKASIGLVNEGMSADDREVFPHLEDTYADVIFFKGFRLVRFDDCNLLLRNEGADESKGGEPYRVEVSIPLDRMNYKKGKNPFRRRKSPETLRLYGTWRAQFKAKGEQNFIRMTFLEPDARQIEGGILTFTFEDEPTSRKFNRAFRRAIKLCNAK